jgi:molybdopterin-guanine dinucleotide biosynthesis protein B
MPIIAVVGSRKSGKTTTVETIVRGLTQKGYRVTTAKHIPETNFTIDTEGKDTWRHAKAGAHTVVSVAPNEVAIIKKVDTAKYRLDEITKECPEDADVTILEGFTKLVAQDPSVLKVVTVKAVDEIRKATDRFEPILTFAGSIKTQEVPPRVPYIDALKQPEEMIEFVEKALTSRAKKEEKSLERLAIQINGKPLPINPFVQRMIRNPLLAMVSTLKKTDIKGNETVSVTIEKPHK